ncbi:MAG: cysteine hydrolase [Bacteroidetes bacterium]|nr:MAG: cysteine hydrolase [Bacteroidota bacterium]
MKKVLSLLIIGLFALPAFSQEKGVDQPEKKELKPALLVIDVQNKFMPMMSEADQKSAPEYINAYIWLFRQHNLPVIRVYHTDSEWGPEPGSEEFAFPKTFNTEESDPLVIKNFPNAFTKTNLDSLLRATGCNTLFLCGLSATGCVLATYFGAYDHEYEVFMLENALLSPDADLTKAVQKFTDTVSWSVVNLLLGYAR